MSDALAQFRADYAHHRATEGRAVRGAELESLPYLRSGPLAKQWGVRARSFDAFLRHVIAPREKGRVLEILDLGAGNGWLSHRVSRRGHKAMALDMRNDDIDGLGAAAEFLRKEPGLFTCITASFDDLPFVDCRFDITVFNASLHYARDLAHVLREATRVTRQDGVLVVMDSPFYAKDSAGAAMVAEKHAQGAARFGDRAAHLLSQGFIEYLTPDRLASASPGLVWRRHRVLYPAWYELRPLMAKLKRARTPSRFDLWIATPT